MARGYPDYTYFQFPLGVNAGGTGATSLTLHGVLLGQGTSGIVATAAGTAYESLQVPAAGGDPAFDQVHLDQSGAVTGVLAKANGGNGTATPALVQGTGISVTGSWPAQTITNTGQTTPISLPLSVANGGWGNNTGSYTGTGAVALNAGGSNQTVTLTPSGTASVVIGAIAASDFLSIGAPSSQNTTARLTRQIDSKESSVGYWSQAALTGATPIWVNGLHASSYNYAIWSFDGSTSIDGLVLERDGHVTFGGVRIAPSPSAGQVLIASASNAAAWATPDGCRVYHNTTQTASSGSFLSVAFNSETYSRGGMHSTVTNNTRITCQHAGVHAFWGQIELVLLAASTFILQIVLNNTTALGYTAEILAASGTYDFQISGEWLMSVNDYVELRVFQNSGSNATVNSVSGTSPIFAAQWLGP